MEKIAVFRCLKEDFNGSGIINYNNKDYKINGILEGEEGEFFVNKNSKSPLKLKKIIKTSKNRIKPVCIHNLECGGCQYQHISYEHEIFLKDSYIKDIFSKFRDFKYLGISKMDDPYYYRNKCQMTYKLSKTNKVVSGFYAEGSHNIISVTDCVIQNKKCMDIINKFNRVLSKNHIKPYNEYTHEGIVRHVLLRYGYNTDEVMIIIITNGDFFPGRRNVVNQLLKLNLGITTIVQNYNSRDTSIVLSDKEKVLYGKGFIFDKIGDLKFKISSRAFYQINSKGMSILYNSAIEMANLKKNDIVLDTYCGVGTIGMIASKHVKKVYGIEKNPLSVKDAIFNSKINNISNIEFINEDSTIFMNNIARNKDHIDVVIMDPPREGSTDEFIENVSKLNPRIIIYVSCNPQTLERDCYKFSQVGYSLKILKAVDMFPRTFNLESVAVIERNSKVLKNRFISNADLDMMKLDNYDKKMME